jgi:hypothetical protein
MYLCSIIVSPKNEEGPGEGKGKNKARVEPARLQACNNDARLGPESSPQTIPHSNPIVWFIGVRDPAW